MNPAIPPKSRPLLRGSMELSEEDGLNPPGEMSIETKILQIGHLVEENESLLDQDQCEFHSTWLSRSKKWTTSQKSRGRKGGLFLAIIADALVVLIILILIFIMSFGMKREGTEAVLVDGSCSKTGSYSIWFHLLINVFSTTLLSTGSYIMQLLSSPTESEVKKAHRTHTYINIGQISLRNFKLIQPKRAIAYLVLGLSSVPIHLLANATVYATKGANSYINFVVSNDFQQFLQLEDDLLSYQISGLFWDTNNVSSPRDVDLEQAGRFANLSASMTRLKNFDCIKAYSNPFNSGYRNLIIVTKYPHETNFSTSKILPGSRFVDSQLPWLGGLSYKTTDSVVQSFSYQVTTLGGTGSTTSTQSTISGWVLEDPSTWICEYSPTTGCHISPGVCNIPRALAAASDFVVCGQLSAPYAVDYCLSEVVEENCKLHGNIPIAVAVLICAIVKLALLILVWRTLPMDLLGTAGDAIAFFLKKPEPETADCSLLDYDLVENAYEQAAPGRHDMWPPASRGPRRWSDQSKHGRWGRQIPGIPMTCSILLQIGTIAGCAVFLDTAKAHQTDRGLSKLAGYWASGFGTANLNFILNMSGLRQNSDHLGKLVLVNLPQLYFSFYYFFYNACWTGMLNAKEWAHFGQRHQALRVSRPSGAQKSTYFLAIPYSFAVPLLIQSVILHWVVSQTLFYVRIDNRAAEPFQPPSASVISTIGYSPLAVVMLMGLIGITGLILVVVAAAARTKTPITAANGCSLAISAACHGPADDTQSWLKPLRWGVIDSMEKDGILHCALTSKETSFFDRVEMGQKKKVTGEAQSVAEFA